MTILQSTKYTVGLLLLFLAFTVYTQHENITFEHFTQDDGLSAPVTKIIQDHYGFLWLGTTDGLNRFDGKNFIVYRNQAGDTTSMPNNIINDLCVDASGRVWAATNGGLCYYHFADDAFHHIEFDNTLEKIDRHRVHAVIPAKDKGMWFATKTFLHYWQEGKPVESYVVPSDEKLSLKYLYEDDNRLIWIGTNDTLYVFNPNTKKFLKTKIVSPFTKARDLTVTIHPILPYRLDTLLMGSWYGGVHKIFIMDDSIHQVHMDDLVETDPRKHIVHGMCKNDAGMYWVGTYGNGLSLLDPRTSTFIQHFHHDPADAKSLGTDYIFDVFLDASGILWIGNLTGLDKYDPLTQQFKSVSIPAPSNVFSVYRTPGHITEDRLDPQWLWVTVSGIGLLHYNTSTRQFVKYENDPSDPRSLPDNTIYNIFYDRQGKIWIGMKSGLCWFDQEKNIFTPVQMPLDSMPPGVHEILQDRYDNYWFATQYDGIYFYDSNRKKIMVYDYDPDNPNSLPDNRVFCILEDSEGFIWAGTQNKGLCRLDPRNGNYIFFEHSKSDPCTIPDNGVYDLWEDDNRLLWIATENGLAAMDLNDFSIQHFTTRDKLCNNDIFSMTPDDKGNLWLATNNGLSRFDPVQRTFKNYFEHDGLPDNSIRGAAYWSSDGSLYLGTQEMLTFCHPDEMKMNKRVPPVVITNFKIFDRQVPVMRDQEKLQPIHLSYRENMITFEFAALNFTNSILNQYKFKLEGFDEQWILNGSKQSATFTNLDGGTYTFHVMAANNDGVWNEEGASVILIVHPPYWRTWWFYMLVVFAIAGILYGIYRMRINQLMKLQVIRTRISRDLHDDIGSTLSSINMISSMASHTAQADKKTTDLFKTISSASSQAMELMGDIVWSINPKNDKMEMILIRMRQYASEILEAAQISFTLDMDESCNHLSLPIEKRKDFYLIFKEAINNLAKYSRAKNVHIRLSLNNRVLLLQITDNGIGFDPSIKYSGNGLKNMKARAVQLEGDISISSSPGDGTSLALKIPVSP